MKKLLQQRTRAGQLFPYPYEGALVEETPPVFSWLREDGTGEYRILVKKASGEIVEDTASSRTFYVPENPYAPGEYIWNLMTEDGERGWIRFRIADDAPRIFRTGAAEILSRVPESHPRLLFVPQEIPSILSERPETLRTLIRNVEKAYLDGMPEPPMYHMDPSALPYREYFGHYRDYIDRDLSACAIYYGLTGDEKAGAHAKKLFLTAASFSPEGPCSLLGPWGDEVGLSNARCFPAVFDLLFPLLNHQEKIFAARTVADYARQCLDRLTGLDYEQFPGDSHSGRLPAYLGNAAIALWGTGTVAREELVSWLDTALDLYGGIFPYFGCPDGGWAEGMFYASSYTKWFLPFFAAVKRYSETDFLMRPFYRHYVRYLQHFCPPGWEIHPFGDGYWCKSEDPEWPGFMAQNPYAVYAERFGSPLLRSWENFSREPDLFLLHVLDTVLPVPDAPINPEPVTRAALFPETGLLSLHTDPTHPETSLALLARASRFGSASHSHADQGSFALMAGGTAMICPSGYFGRQYGTKHHFEWTNSSKAHNTLLVGGIGQETFSYTAVGKVLYAEDLGDRLEAAVDPSEAYEHVKYWNRRFILNDVGLTVEDELQLDMPLPVTYCLHTLSRPDENLMLERDDWHMMIIPDPGIFVRQTVSDSFGVDINEGEPEAFHVTMPSQYHIIMETAPSEKFHFRVQFKVKKNNP